MKRRTLLAGLGASAAGSAILFGSGAFTQVEAERDLTIGVDEDSNALLALEAGEVASVFSDSGELVIDTDELSNGNEGFNVNSSVLIGETKQDIVNRNPGEAEVVADLGSAAGGTGAAFRLTNNFDSTANDSDQIDVGVNLEDIDAGDSSLTFIISKYSDGGGRDESSDSDFTVSDGSQVVVNNLKSGDELYFAIEIETGSATQPDDIVGDITFRAGPNLDNAFPTSPVQASDPVVNVTQDIASPNISDAIAAAAEGDLVQATSDTYDEAVNVNVPGLRLEGPNAGVSGDASRGSEAEVTQPVTVSADGVTVDGFSVSPPGPGDDKQNSEAILVSDNADNVTVENNIVEDFARSTGSEFFGVGGIVLFGGDSADAVENPTVQDNLVRRLKNTASGGGGAAGISVQGNVVDATVEQNTVENIGQEETNFGFGIVVRGTGNHKVDPTGVTVRDNQVSTVQSDPKEDTVGVGIGLEAGDSSDVTFEDNDVSNVEFLLEDKTATVNLSSFANVNTLDRGALLENADFSGEPGGAPTRNVIFDSIGAAATENSRVSDGDTIELVAGTYNEAVDITNNNLTLAAVSDAVTQPENRPTIETDASVDKRAVKVDATGETLDGLDITFVDGSDSSNAEKTAVRSFPSSGTLDLTVRNCAIRDFATSDDDNNDGAVRATGIGIDTTINDSPTSGLTVENCIFDNIRCTGNVDNPNSAPDADSKAKAVGLTGEVNGARIVDNTFSNIGTVANPQPDTARTVSKSGDAAKGTEKPRGISLVEGDTRNTIHKNFEIVRNDFDGIEGTFGQPAIFIGGSSQGLGANHVVEENNFRHPVDNLSGGSALNLTRNYWEGGQTGTSTDPALVSPDNDEDGGVLIDRETNNESDNYDVSRNQENPVSDAGSSLSL
jgi:hypothetical protein